MIKEPSTHDPSPRRNEQGGSDMELTKTQELIKRLKDAKAEKELTFPRIIERMERNGKFVSLSTLRRVFADGSEITANFSYENTLLPIAEAVLAMDENDDPDDSPEVLGLKAVIHVQNEELAKMQEIKEHLEGRINFLLEQIEKKDRRMDEKDEIIRRLMDKVL